VRQALYLAWRYLAFHRLKTAILVTSISLILFIPVGLRVLVEQSSRQLTARAETTPLIAGAKGSPLELVLNTLYFASDIPEPTPYSRYLDLAATGLAVPLPMYVRFEAQGHPIVGTSLDYFEFRGLGIAHGRQLAMLGECVIGSRVAAAMGMGPGDFVVSSPESVFDIAGVYPLRMKVVGVLAYSDGADDDGIFVDLKTSWIIAGLGHGHQDLTAPEAASGVLSRDSASVTANASVVQYNEITDDNADTFHFHGDLGSYPLTAVIAVPPDQKSSALLQGRFEGTDSTNQIVRPDDVMGELLGTILTVESFVVAGAVLVGLATAATVALVFLLSLRLRRRERDTMYKIGGSRSVVGFVMASEVIAVLVLSVAIAALLTVLTSEFGSSAVRTLIRM
jgi:putative ABC transport system permease protein